MKIGFLGDYSEKALDFAKAVGFDGMSLSAWPDHATFKIGYEQNRPEEIKEAFASRGLCITAVGCYPNHLDPNPEVAKAHQAHFRKVMELARKLDVDVVTTFSGNDPEKSFEENMPAFKKVFSEYVRIARDLDLKIAIENCPMMHGHPFRGCNLAYSPAAWELMFDAVPDERLGLELDPSHLYWLMIDYVEVVREFGPRIHHVHAKDTEVFWDKLGRVGIYCSGWWRYRIPGWGEIDWGRFISALLDVGYDYALSIEHEDPVFHGPRHWEGLELGLRHLSQFVPRVPKGYEA